MFLTPRNLLNILWAVSILGIVALGQTLLLLTCRFDMSVAAVVGFSGIVTVLAQIHGFGLYASVVCGLAAGGIVGLCNGLIVLVTGAESVPGDARDQPARLRPLAHAHPVKDALRHGAGLQHAGPGPALRLSPLLGDFLVALAVALQFALSRTIFGRTIFVVGLNETAGRLSGLRIPATKLTAFVLCSTLAALAGIVMTSRINSTVANSGFGMDFEFHHRLGAWRHQPVWRARRHIADHRGRRGAGCYE